MNSQHIINYQSHLHYVPKTESDEFWSILKNLSRRIKKKMFKHNGLQDKGYTLLFRLKVLK